VLEKLEQQLRGALPAADFASARYVCDRYEDLGVRQDVPEPVGRGEDRGVMITVADAGGLGYAATCDLSPGGLKAAADRAKSWARKTAGRCVTDFTSLYPAAPQGEYVGPEAAPWASVPTNEKFDLLTGLCARLKTDDRIVDWSTSLAHVGREQLYLTGEGGRVYQKFSYVYPDLRATANEGAVTQYRSLGGRGYCRQGGMEVVEDVHLAEAPESVAAEAGEVLGAPDCPSATMDIVLDPGQMILQIHESIGHPLELDRILGDERNYAGTSFVTLDMVGSYRYGSELLNIVFDPTRPEQLASFGFDDDGTKAEKVFLIEKGILKAVLGGAISQARSAKFAPGGAPVAGVANCRATTWNRPPVDRMANLNLEPGDSTFAQMIASVERGVYMRANRSWSIDDSRNKFQFGCEWGRLIEDGQLAGVVKTPNYRGISATFWRNLAMVGDLSTFCVLGTPNCGKGEPNQIMRVGHATPTCRFADVEVFGGA
jgi:predicted Zn-dependent protease